MNRGLERAVESKAKISLGNGRLIYVSGRYRADTEEQKRDNVWHATRVSVRLWELGWVVLSPINNSAYFDVYSSLPDGVFLEGDLKFLEFMDAIFMLKGYEDSTGAMVELLWAKDLGKEVFYE